MKKLRIGRRRGRGDELALSPLELALYPALADARWQVPDRFNFARDVVEALAHDPKRRAVTFIGKDGIIEPRTFHQIVERSARWSWLLRERGVRPGDPVLVLVGTNVDWVEIVLACLKVGAVVVPSTPHVTAETLDVRVSRTGAELIVAEPTVGPEIARMHERPQVLYVDEGVGLLDTVDDHAPTHDSAARDTAFVLTTAGTAGGPKLVGHSHGSVFAARVAAEHWLDAGRGDAVWAPADPGSIVATMYALVGPWSRGAETLLHDGPFDPLERLDLVYRLGVTVMCQSPAEYAAIAALSEVTRFQPPQLRRLVSTGDYLDPEVTKVFEEAWGLTIHDAYGQAETGVVLANSGEAGFKPGSIGYPLPGHQVAVIDDQGNELPPKVEGELAVRGRPPTLFAGYWESPDETKQAFRGDWYATGDIATVDHEGFFWFVSRASDLITSRGENFGPHEAERALRAQEAVAAAAVVGVRDLERGGQFVRAYVVPAPRVRTSEQLEAELRHEVGLVLPTQAVPREIEFVEDLPTAPGGKVRRLELRERLVVGRSLLDLPPTSEEAEPDKWGAMLAPWPAGTEAVETPAAEQPVDETDEVLPDYIVPPAPEPAPVVEPEPEVVEIAPVAEVMAEPVVEVDAEAEPEAPPPVLEPLPDYEVVPRVSEPAPQAEIVDVRAEAAPEPEPVTPEVEPEPSAPETSPLPALSVVPEPVELDESPTEEPEPEQEPEPSARPEPEHVAEFEPVVPFEPEFVAPELEAAPELEPEPEPEPMVWTPLPSLGSTHQLEPEPDVDSEPEPEAAPVPEAEPEPVAEAVWMPVPGEPEPPAVESEPPQASMSLEPPPDPGPLPDYVVDPDKDTDPPPRPEPAVQPEPESKAWPSPAFLGETTPSPDSDPEPSLDNLGLPPLTEFPGVSRDRPSEADRQTAEHRPAEVTSRPAAAQPKRRGRRGRSEGEPGDEQEGLGWMDGLSNRLSAYSLAEEGESPPEADADEAPAPPQDPDE